MWKRMTALAQSFWDEIGIRTQSVFHTIKNTTERAIAGHGGLIRLAFDITIGVLICILSPIVAVGIAGANFIDGVDTFGAVLTLAAAFIVLEVVALWSLEVIAVLVAFQFSRISVRFLDNYKKRRALELA